MSDDITLPRHMIERAVKTLREGDKNFYGESSHVALMLEKELNKTSGSPDLALEQWGLAARLRLIASECSDSDTTDALDELIETLEVHQTADDEAAKYREFVEIACAKIKAADDAAADNDYMLDSDDCIKVLRGEWPGAVLNDCPPKPERAEVTESSGQGPAPAAWRWMGRKGWIEYGPEPHDLYACEPLFLHPLSGPASVSHCQPLTDEKIQQLKREADSKSVKCQRQIPWFSIFTSLVEREHGIGRNS